MKFERCVQKWLLLTKHQKSEKENASKLSEELTERNIVDKVFEKLQDKFRLRVKARKKTIGRGNIR